MAGADGRVDVYTAEIISSREYSAYGAELPGYSYSEGEYRYGFQNQEVDEELWDGAVSQENRITETNTSRFCSVDNRADKYPSSSPYAFLYLSPMKNVEANGDTIWVYYQYSDANGQQKVVNFVQINTSSENIYITITQDQIPTSVVAGVNLVAEGNTGPVIVDMSATSKPTDGSVDATIMSFGWMFGAGLVGSFSIDYVSMINGKDAGKNFLLSPLVVMLVAEGV